MFREMRRKNQLLPKEETVKILENGTSGTLSLLGDDDYPYALPLSYVFTGEKIYFHCAKSGHKIDAVKKHDKASFCVIAKDDVMSKEFTTYFQSAIVFGKIRILEDEKEIRKSIEILAKKYSPDDDNGISKEIDKYYNSLCMLELCIEHMTGKEAKELAIMRHLEDK